MVEAKSTALQRPWMKDLSPPVIKMAKAKAQVALAAWNDTVAGILAAAKAVYEVSETIGGAPSGSFAAWGKDELDRSSFTVSALASIGRRYSFLSRAKNQLPPSWTTLYELTKESDDDVFQRALRRVNPDMGRNEMICLVAEERADLPKKKAKQKSQQQKEKQQKETRALPSPSPLEPRPREAATATILAGSAWRTVKDLADRVDYALASGALAPEAKRFMTDNYLRPSRELIEAMEKKLAVKQIECNSAQGVVQRWTLGCGCV